MGLQDSAVIFQRGDVEVLGALEAGEVQLGEDPQTFGEVSFTIAVNKYYEVLAGTIASKFFTIGFAQNAGLKDWVIGGIDAVDTNSHPIFRDF